MKCLSANETTSHLQVLQNHCLDADATEPYNHDGSSHDTVYYAFQNSHDMWEPETPDSICLRHASLTPPPGQAIASLGPQHLQQQYTSHSLSRQPSKSTTVSTDPLESCSSSCSASTSGTVISSYQSPSWLTSGDGFDDLMTLIAGQATPELKQALQNKVSPDSMDFG
jgi:hypothetical protein